MAVPLSGMRIIALPLTARPTSSSFPFPLIYYHFQTPPRKRDQHDKNSQSVVRRITNKAADIWAGFGKAPEGNWKRKVFIYGEKIVDRVDFEELSLKGVDPSLGPRIGQRRQEAEKVNSLVKIPLLYPPSCDFGHGVGSSPLPHIQALLSRRTPQHKKGFYVWLGIAPITVPFALIPLVPNLPFFYAAWRAWSHYRAWKASQYLEGLITSNHVIPQQSTILDEVYASSRYQNRPESPQVPGTMSASKSLHQDSRSHSSPQIDLLLDKSSIPRILEVFQLKESAGMSILRAIEQANVRIRKDALS